MAEGPGLPKIGKANMEKLKFGHIAGGVADSLLAGPLIAARGQIRNLLDPRIHLANWAAGNPIARQIQNTAYNVQYRRNAGIKPFENNVSLPRTGVDPSQLNTGGTAVPAPVQASSEVGSELQRALAPTNSILYSILGATKSAQSITQGGFAGMMAGMQSVRATTDSGLKEVTQETSRGNRTLVESFKRMFAIQDRQKFQDAENATEGNKGQSAGPESPAAKKRGWMFEIAAAVGGLLLILGTKIGQEFAQITAVSVRVFKMLRGNVAANGTKMVEGVTTAVAGIRQSLVAILQTGRASIVSLSGKSVVAATNIMKAVTASLEMVAKTAEAVTKSSAVKIIGQLSGISSWFKGFETIGKMLKGLNLGGKGIDDAAKVAETISKSGGIWSKMSSIFSTIVKVAGDLSGITRVFRTITLFAKAIPIIGEVIIAVQAIFDGFKGFVKGFKGTDGNMFQKILGGLWGGLTGVIKGLIEPFAMLGNWVKNTVAKLLGMFGLTGVEEALKKFDLVEGLTTLFNKIAVPAEAGRLITQLIMDLIRRFTNNVAAVKGSLQDVANNIFSGGSTKLAPPAPGMKGLRDTIAHTEGTTDAIAQRDYGIKSGYDVALGGKGSHTYKEITVKAPPRPRDEAGRELELTEMTIDQVLRWQEQWKYQQDKAGIPGNRISTAAGRYQIVNKTLKGLVKNHGISHQEKFSPEMQDMLADSLIKGRGGDDFKAGRITANQLHKNLESEWEGIQKRQDLKADVIRAIEGVKTPVLPPIHSKTQKQAERVGAQNLDASRANWERESVRSTTVIAPTTNSQVNNSTTVAARGPTRYDRSALDKRH